MTYDTTLHDVSQRPQWEKFSSTGRWRSIPNLAWLPPMSRGGLATVVALAIIFLFNSFYRLNHTDLWGHLSFGRWIVEHGELPTSDPWREFAGAERFVNVPWLSQVLGYLWYQVAGAEGLVLAHVLLVTLTFGFLMAAIRRRQRSAAWAASGALAGYILALPIVGTIRPQLFGGAAFAISLLGIAQLERRRHPLVWLPLVFAAWANLHGSVIVGLAALGCMALGTVFESARSLGGLRGGLADPKSRRMLLACVLATAGACCNPAGPRLLVDAVGFAGSVNLAAISEWRPLVIGSLSGSLFLLSVVVLGVLLRFSPREIRPHEVLLMIVFGVMAMSALRMLYWWAILWPWVVVPHAAAAWAPRGGRDKDDSEGSQPSTTRTLIACLIVFMALVWAPSTHAFIVGQPRAQPVIVAHDTPIYLGEEIARRNLTGRIFAPMDWADYFVFQTGGTIQPLVHSHVHLITANAWDDYQAISRGTADWLKIVDHYQLQYLVVRREPGFGLDNLVLAHPRCRVVYQDQQGILVQVLPESNEPAAPARSEK